MTSPDAEQLALDGLAPRKRRKRAPAAKTPASTDPVVQVVLDIQATHLGRTFDYLIEESQSEAAQPGVMVRVRFGGQRVGGIIWNRVAAGETPMSSLRYVERVYGPQPIVSASMREDITRVAEAYGGTRANIVRLAVPPRVARIDEEQRLAASSVWRGRQRFGERSEQVAGAAERGAARFAASYADAARLRSALEGSGFSPFVVDALPGPERWARELAWMALEAMLAGKAAVLVLPTMREVQDMTVALRSCGLRPFIPNPASNGGYSGDFAVLSASMPPAERYRAYTSIANGQVRCAIGPRAAMYAPVEGPALFAIFDDLAYQNMDGFMPYPNARGVLRLRAKAHGGVFVAMAHARSPISQWEACGTGASGDPAAGAARETPTCGYSMPIHALPAVTKERSPWIRWLNRDELARLADPSIGARVPHTAVRVLAKALEQGPVLLSIPADGVAGALSCAKCHRQARCRRCTGPLQRERDDGVRCRWCGAAAVNWTCLGCGGDRLRVVRVGAAGTAQELAGLFRGVPIVVSSRNQPRGVVESIECRPQIVIATPGCEPRVSPVPGNDGPQGHEYRAVAILDAWTSLYALGMDARPDTLCSWMRAMAMCAPRARGGQGLLIGETDPALAQALMLWDAPLLAAKEIAERAQTGFPPVLGAACVWGRRDAVMTALSRIGVTGEGDWTRVESDGVPVPAVLGPVPIPQPATINARELENTADRVKAVVLVDLTRRAELATRLRAAVAKHVASREPGELRFRLDPKDL